MDLRSLVHLGAAAASVVALSSPVSRAASSAFSARFVRPPTAIDAGADRLPPAGVNDSINIPSSSACPRPGAGACAADPNTTCSLAPGSAADPFSSECGLSGGTCGGPAATETCCVETLTGPDGITAADAPSTGLFNRRSLKSDVQVTIEGYPTTRAKIRCRARNVRDSLDVRVSTTRAGTCHGGANNGVSCTSNRRCGAGYFCEGGDEYNCEVDFLMGSNKDDSPPCGLPCLMALVSGPPGVGCATVAGGLCSVGTCSGGSVRDGQACDILGSLSCPGGFCDGLGSQVLLSGDEAGLAAPALGGMVYALCPFEFQLGLPLDLSRGSGFAKTDIAADPLHTCLPAVESMQVTGAYLHEPPAIRDSLIEFHTGAGGSGSGHGKQPCPDVALPMLGRIQRHSDDDGCGADHRGDRRSGALILGAGYFRRLPRTETPKERRGIWTFFAGLFCGAAQSRSSSRRAAFATPSARGT